MPIKNLDRLSKAGHHPELRHPRLTAIGHSFGADQTGQSGLEPWVDLDTQELIDAIAAAVDLSRFDEINRLRNALEPFGASRLLDPELRLNGYASSEHVCRWCDTLERS